MAATPAEARACAPRLCFSRNLSITSLTPSAVHPKPSPLVPKITGRSEGFVVQFMASQGVAVGGSI